MEACQTYQVTVTNSLEGPNPGGDWNTMKDPNTTNIHTHGLHISGESPADDVLYVKITPGESHTCENDDDSNEPKPTEDGWHVLVWYNDIAHGAAFVICNPFA